MIPCREGGLRDKTWAWPYILQQHRKHHIWGRAKTTVSPTFCHQLRLVSTRVHVTCVHAAQNNTDMLIHSYPTKSERHHLSCPGCELSAASCSWVSWPTHTFAPCDAKEMPGAVQESSSGEETSTAKPSPHLCPRQYLQPEHSTLMTGFTFQNMSYFLNRAEFNYQVFQCLISCQDWLANASSTYWRGWKKI